MNSGNNMFTVGYQEWNDLEKIKSYDKAIKKIEYRSRYKQMIVDEWNYNDFSFYFEDYILYFSKKKSINISEVSLIFEASMRRNRHYCDIVDFLNNGVSNNYCKLLLKAYMEWYIKYLFENTIKDMPIIDGKKQLTIGVLNNKLFMKKFLIAHDLNEKISGVAGVESKLISYNKKVTVIKKEKQKSLHKITLNDMNSYYDLGIATLLTECGIVLSANYLVKIKGNTLKTASSIIGKYLRSLNLSHERQKKSMLNIIDKTCQGSPYFKDILMLNWDIVYRDVFEKVDEFNIEGFRVTDVEDENSYKFFQKEDK